MEINKSRYTKEAMKQRACLPVVEPEKEDIDKFKKQFYATFLKTWDAELHGEMTPSRFYSAFSHLKTTADVKAMRDLFKWCRANGVPFAPVAWDKYRMRRDKTTPHISKSVSG